MEKHHERWPSDPRCISRMEAREFLDALKEQYGKHAEHLRDLVKDGIVLRAAQMFEIRQMVHKLSESWPSQLEGRGPILLLATYINSCGY